MFPCILICIFSVSPYLNETHCNTHSWDVDKEKRSVRIYSSNCWFTKLCKKRPLIWRHHLHTTDQWTAEWERLQSFPDKTPQRKIDNIKSTVFLLKCWHRVCICISFIWDYRLKSSSSLVTVGLLFSLFILHVVWWTLWSTTLFFLLRPIQLLKVPTSAQQTDGRPSFSIPYVVGNSMVVDLINKINLYS